MLNKDLIIQVEYSKVNDQTLRSIWIVQNYNNKRQSSSPSGYSLHLVNLDDLMNMKETFAHYISGTENALTLNVKSNESIGRFSLDNKTEI